MNKKPMGKQAGKQSRHAYENDRNEQASKHLASPEATCVTCVRVHTQTCSHDPQQSPYVNAANVLVSYRAPIEYDS